MKNSLVLLVVMVVLTGLNLSRPVESAQPAIVNPVGWDKAEVIKHLDTIINTIDKPESTKGSINYTLLRKVCVLPPGMYMEIANSISLFYGYELPEFKKIIKTTCQNYKEALK